MTSFLFTDFSNATASASSANAEYPVNNVLDYNTMSRWVADVATTDMWVRISLPNAIAVTTVVLDDHNCDSVMSSGSIQLQYADDDAFTSNVTTVATLTSTKTDAFTTTFGSVTKRYWRIYYSGQCATNPYIANVFLGTPLEIPNSYTWGYKKGNKQFVTTDKISLSGRLVTSQPYLGREVIEVNCKFLSDTVRSAFADFVESVRGRLFPFYFTDHENTIRFVKFTDDYTPALVQRWNLNEIQTIKMQGFDVRLTSAETSALPDIYKVYEDEWIDTVS